MGHFKAVEVANAIRDALQEVVAALEDGVDAPEALRLASEETGLNPQLIERKFVEQHKVAASDYMAVKAQRKQAQTTNAAGRLREAHQSAVAWSKQFVFAPGRAERVGLSFEVNNEQYLLVAMVGGDKFPIKAIHVGTGQRKGLAGAKAAEAVAVALKGV